MSRSFSPTSFLFSDSVGSFSEQVAYTVALWVKRAATTSELECYSEGSRSSSSPFFLLRTGPTSGKAAVTCRNNAGGSSQLSNVTTAATVFDGTWHHLAYTQDNLGNYAMYVDGVADTSAHGSYTPGATSINCVCVGALRRTTTVNEFDAGSCAHVATWLRRLSTDEFRILGSGASPSLLNPSYYWPLWGFDATEPDLASGRTGLSTATGPTPGATNPPVNVYRDPQMPRRLIRIGKAVSPASAIKTFMGVTYPTNVKTAAGLNQSSIKTVDGLA